MTPRHLAIFLPSLDAGGAEKVMLALAAQFVARGIRCDLVVVKNEGQLRDCVPCGVNVVVLGKRKPIMAVPALLAYLRKARPHVLLSTIFSANITALLAGMLARTHRIVIREANHVSIDTETSSPLTTWLNRMAARMLYRHADAAIAVAKSVAQSLRDERYIPDFRIHVIVNPLPPQTQSPRPERHPTVPKTIVACGRLEPQKDYPTLLKAFSELRQRMDARLIILGEGSLRVELEALSYRLKLQDSVTFAGFDPKAGKRIREADVFAHAAIFEGMSNAILEALSAGCPIVATDCKGGVSDALDGGRYGTLVPVGDATAMADALERVLDGSVTFPSPVEYLKRFDQNMIADQYVSVLFPAQQL